MPIPFSTLKMATAYPSEMSMSAYKNKGCHNPEHHNLNSLKYSALIFLYSEVRDFYKLMLLSSFNSGPIFQTGIPFNVSI
jgi:hypothetical protein